MEQTDQEQAARHEKPWFGELTESLPIILIAEVVLLSHFPDEDTEAQGQESNGKDVSHSTDSRDVTNTPKRLFLISKETPS